MNHRTDSNPRAAGAELPWGWIILCATFLTALVVLLAYHNAVRWQNVVWYQVVSGLLLAISGGAITGWGIAAFIASSKGTTAHAPANETRPKEPPTPMGSPPPVASKTDPGKPDAEKSVAGETPSAAGTAAEELAPDDPLEAVGGIGQERARDAATLGFNKLSDLVTATPEDQQKLKSVWGNALFTAVLVLALAAAAHQTGRKQ